MSQEKKQTRIIYLISTAITSGLNNDEQKELDNWLASDAANRQLFDELANPDIRKNELQKMARYDEVAALHTFTTKHNQTPKTIRFPRLAKWMVSAVAASVLLAICFVGYNKYTRASKPYMITIKVPYGKKTDIILPDGSHVWLNAGSILIYPSAFRDSTRNIEMAEGEAFFQVTHNKEKPFVINTSDVSVRVLGTSFSVKSYTDDSDTKIAVQTGKVSVKAGEKTVLLSASEQAVYSRTRGNLVKSKVYATDIASWRTGMIVFDNENLGDVLHALERRYNSKIKVSDTKLAHEKVYLKLENHPLADVMSILSFTKHFKYDQINDSTIHIK